jgi:hypothetical protein
MKRTAIFLLVLMFSTEAFAQLDEIVVTARKRESYYDMPAVMIDKKADFLVQSIRLVNDSRSPNLRRDEIIQTIDHLVNASKKIAGIELSYGEGFLTPINLSDDSIRMVNERDRIDTSYVAIFVKIAFDGKRTPKRQIAELRSFIANAELTGRTEIDLRGDIGLSILDPQQYRYEILAKIAEESGNIQKTVGGDCETKIGGLEGRVQWERTDLDELTLYIAYGTEITCK